MKLKLVILLICILVLTACQRVTVYDNFETGQATYSKETCIVEWCW